MKLGHCKTCKWWHELKHIVKEPREGICGYQTRNMEPHITKADNYCPDYWNKNKKI